MCVSIFLLLLLLPSRLSEAESGTVPADCFDPLLLPEPVRLPPPPPSDWTWSATVLQPWGPTQYEMVTKASQLAGSLRSVYGFNTLILLPEPAHRSYCAPNSACALTADTIASAVSVYRAAGWRVILYTSYMHCGEAQAWTNGSLNRAHPGWAQRNSSGAPWLFEGDNSPLSPCSAEVLEYTSDYAQAQAASFGAADAVMLDNNEMGPLTWGCASSACGYEPPCAAAFDAFVRARFNASTLRHCFGVEASGGVGVKPPVRSQVGQPIYGLWVHWRAAAMASLMQYFAARLRRPAGRRLLANTAVEWPDFSLATDFQYVRVVW